MADYEFSSNRNLPILNMTALSYSATTLKQMNSENGKVIIIRSMDPAAARISMHPEFSPSANTQKIIDNQLTDILESPTREVIKRRCEL